MFDIKTFIQNVFKSNIRKFSERVTTCEIEFEVSKKDFPSYNDFINCVNSINFKNKTQIEIINPDEDILFISNANIKSAHEYNSYLSNSEEDDVFDIKINIQKEIFDNHFVIYNYKSFTEDILDNSIVEMMVIFSNFLKTRDSIIFNILDENLFWSTKSIMFTSNSDSCFSETIKRKSRIETCELSSFFQNAANFELLPDDFDIVNNIKDNPFEDVFNRIKTILSLCYLSSLSTIGIEHLKCVINGQRSVSFEYHLDKVYSNKILYNIYYWIFTDGNYVDKAVIARNIISLHCKYCSILDIDSTIFISICSNYGIYLKENVSQYLEAKTKVSEFISNIGSKTSESAYELLNDFKKNIIAVFSFLLTVILVNIVSEHPLENILTKEITTILELILVGSVAYYLISLIQTISGFKRITNSYFSLRRSYEGVFSIDEMRDIFDEDNIYTQSKKHVKKCIICFSVIWIAVIIISVIAIEMMSENPVISPLLNNLYMYIKSFISR